MHHFCTKKSKKFPDSSLLGKLPRHPSPDPLGACGSSTPLQRRGLDALGVSTLCYTKPCTRLCRRPIVLRDQHTQTRNSVVSLIDRRLAEVYNRAMALFRSALTIALRFTTSDTERPSCITNCA